MKKKDIAVVGIIIFTIVFLSCFWLWTQREKPSLVQVKMQGKIYGTYPLDKNQEILIGHTNKLKIEDKKAKMIWASCDNQICVHHKEIWRNHETITCLPNQIVVEIIDGKEEGPDSVVK